MGAPGRQHFRATLLPPPRAFLFGKKQPAAPAAPTVPEPVDVPSNLALKLPLPVQYAQVWL